MCHPDKGKGGLCSEWSKRELTLPIAVLSSLRTAASFGMDDAMSGETTMVEGDWKHCCLCGEDTFGVLPP